MKNYIKKFIVGLLVMVMTVTGIDYVPANADEVNNYYVGFNGNLTVDNIMTAEDDVYTYTYGQIAKGDTLSFGIYTSTNWTDVACAWNDYDAYSGGYCKICFDGSKVVLKIYEDAEYTTYIEDTTVPVVFDYYIGFSNLFGMASEDGLYVYEYGEYTANDNIGFGIYNTKDWNDVAVAWGNHTADKSGYAKIYYNADTKDVSVKVFTDDTYTTEVSDEPVEDVTYYA